jgi:DNA methylase
VTPYYADEDVTLYLGDCREVTEWLTANVLVTDPPYGRKFRAPESHTGRDFFGGRGRIAGDESTAIRDAALAMWGDRTAAVFGDLVLQPIAGTKQTLIYRKPPNAGSFGALGCWRRDVEAIYLAGPWPTSVGGASSILGTDARHTNVISGNRYGHPHAKPIDVMETLIAACPPGVIADPFAGAGSTLVAARNLGRRAIGVELDELYAERAARRLSQGVLLQT